MNDRPISRVLQALYDTTGYEPKRQGNGFKAICPCHDDHDPSLKVDENDDGTVLFNCFVGCRNEDIVKAIGLDWPNLFPASTSTQTSQIPKKQQYRRRRQRNGRQKAVSYATAREAVKSLDSVMAKQQGCRVAQWTYQDDRGQPVLVVVRYDLPTAEGEKRDKTFRPVGLHPDGWRLADPPGSLPLFNLARIADARRIYVHEGEKACDAAQAIELTSTTAAHGANCAAKTDWTPLAGVEVILTPDNDESGGTWTDAVKSELAKLTPLPTVKIVDLQGLPPKGDIVEFIAAQRQSGLDDDAIRDAIEKLADEALPVELDRPTPPIKRYQPFPVNALPQPLRRFVKEASQAIGCDSSYIALPVLAAVAGCIGNTYRVVLKRTWTEPSVLWCAVIAESGSLKTPAHRLAVQHLHIVQADAIKKHHDQEAQHQVELLQYEIEMREWKHNGGVGDPPVEPPEPSLRRTVISDVTIEAVAPILLENPRGVLLASDELAAWVNNFDRYASGGKGKSADAPKWLNMHDAGDIVVDRKGGKPKTLHVPYAAVSVCGGIQPRTLARVFTPELRENGTLARLLVSMPPTKPAKWSNNEIDEKTERAYVDVLDALLSLATGVDDEGQLRPRLIPLDDQAKERFTEWHDGHADEMTQLAGDEAAAYSKLKGYCPRLALIIHCTRVVSRDDKPANAGQIDLQTLEAAIKLIEWFKAESLRVYAILAETESENQRRRLSEWIERKGGSVTAREVQQGRRQYQTSEDAETALQDLMKAGYGYWEQSPRGWRGHPTRRFVLRDAPTVYGNTLKSDENHNSVVVDSEDATETQDWGEV